MGKESFVVTGPIVLGRGDKGKQRQQILFDWAEEIGLEWKGKPSVSKLIQHLADERARSIEAKGPSIAYLRRRIKELERELEKVSNKG